MRLHSLVALASLPLLFASGALAQENTIHGCIKKNGTLKIVSGPGDCSSRETPISWNQVGPAGPQGGAGEPGPEGPQGPPGKSLSVFDAEGQEVGIHAGGTVGSRVDAYLPEINATIFIAHDGEVITQNVQFAGALCSGPAYVELPSFLSGDVAGDRLFVGRAGATLVSWVSYLHSDGSCRESAGDYLLFLADELAPGSFTLGTSVPAPVYIAPGTP